MLFDSSVPLEEIIKEETQHRVIEQIQEPVREILQEQEFVSPQNTPVHNLGTAPLQVEQEDEPYDAETNAVSLVCSIQALEQTILTPVALFKLRHMIGGRETSEAQKAAQVKLFRGEDLTEKEQRILKGLEKYEAKKALVTTALIPSEAKTDQLIKAAIPYCEENRVDVSKGMAFWGSIVGDFVENITKILLS